MLPSYELFAKRVIGSVAQQPQRQDGAQDQLNDLLPFAVKLEVPCARVLRPKPGHQLSPRLEALLQDLQPVERVGELTEEQERLVLHGLANRLGLYDAADILRGRRW